MEDLNIYGKYITVTSVDPTKSFFMARYPDGSIKKGNNLFNTGWDDIPNGLTELSYILSTGHVITFPKFKAYLPLIECSVGLDGSRVFHAINVKCLEDNSVVIWRVVLKQDPTSKFKIGDIILGREPLPNTMSSSWKYTS
jgi:hypothetical protein